MGYRKLSKTDIDDLLRRRRTGQGIRLIARETSIDRKTIRRYLNAAKVCEIGVEREPDDEDVGRVMKRVQARPPRALSEAWKKLLPFKDRIAACVDDAQRLRLRAARVMLAAAGIQVTYWTLRRFAIKARAEKAGAEKVDGDGKADDGRAAAAKAARPADGKSADGRSADSKSADGKSADAKSTDGKSADGRSSDGMKADGRSTDGKPADARSIDVKLADGRSADSRPADGKSADKMTPRPQHA
jgi:hypothetical protein